VYISNSTPATSYEGADHKVNNNWELVTSRHSSEPKELKKLGKHFTFPISKAFATTNPFSMLAGINKSDRSDKVLATTMEQETSNIINKHHNSTNKPVSSKSTLEPSSDSHSLTTSLHKLQDRERKIRMERGYEENPIYSIPTIVNGCVSTKDTFGLTSLRKDKSNNSGNEMVKVYNNRSRVRKEHKIVIIGDSHSRGHAMGVKNHLNNNFEVIGLVKSGAGAEILVKSALSDIVNLTK
jgi:hypothetical protein